MEAVGVEIGLHYIGEGAYIGVGLQTGTTYQGRIELSLDVDFGKLMDWRGAAAHVSVFNIQNGNGENAADYVGSIADPSNIDALRTTRLSTAWVQQDFGASSIRIGQLAADDEFLTSVTAGGLTNSTFGWANIMSANLPSGGAAYPLATPGARLLLSLGSSSALLVGVFAGNPAGKDCGSESPQQCNRRGTTFPTSGGTFWIGEAQHFVNRDRGDDALAGTYKLGAWNHTASFADQRYGLDAAGAVVSLADPAVVAPLMHKGDHGVYGVVDQRPWRGVSVFLRGGVVPGNRNLVQGYVDGGVGISGLLPDRADDVLTLGIAYSRIGSAARGLDRDQAYYTGSTYPVRSAETACQLNYVAQLAPWWTLQPGVQYIVRPGGGAPMPTDSAERIGNAWVFGLRTTVAL